MAQLPGEVTDRSVTVYMTGALCTQPAQLFQSWQARGVIQSFLNGLCRRKSALLRLLGDLSTEGAPHAPSPAAQALARLFSLLVDMPAEDVRVRAPDVAALVAQPEQLAEMVERLYDHWRRYERYLIFEGKADDSRDSALEGHMPFIRNNQDLNALVRLAYRQIQNHLKGFWPRVYRQVPAGANMSLLIEQIHWECPGGVYEQLRSIPMVRLALIAPPVTLYPRRNARRGKFAQLFENPLAHGHLDPTQWFCLPVLVGELRFLFFFDRQYMSLAVSLVNLFELSGHDAARQKPDGIMLFGFPRELLGEHDTAFYVDEEQEIVVGVVGWSDEVDYFGYCKKLTLTLHNVAMMRRGRFPVHGAMSLIRLQDETEFSAVIVGDSGAGKSETLEAFRAMADEWISDMTIVFDDMGSLAVDGQGRLVGYGTEIGAFVRLDDLDPGYAFTQFDRSIFMNPHRQNARVVIPVTTHAHVVAGYPVDLLLYANNYEPVTDTCPALEFFTTPEEALEVFRAGQRAAKGTTDERGLVRTYFANPFGPEQMREMHEPLARQHFAAAFEAGVRVGQLRTRLGIDGWEQKGPLAAAEALFTHLRHQTPSAQRA
jgi:hypothetical protein